MWPWRDAGETEQCAVFVNLGKSHLTKKTAFAMEFFLKKPVACFCHKLRESESYDGKMINWRPGVVVPDMFMQRVITNKINVTESDELSPG